MRFCLTALFLMLVHTFGSAQEFKKLRVGIGAGYGVTSPTFFNSQSQSSPMIYFEPSYRLNDLISIGLRLEAIGQITGSGLNVASYSTNFQYYFLSGNAFRPFAGFGIGYFKPRYQADGFYSYTSRLEDISVGFYPRIGFDWDHLTITFDANLVTRSNALIVPPAFSGNPASLNDLNATYFALKIGVNIGGGKKR